VIRRSTQAALALFLVASAWTTLLASSAWSAPNRMGPRWHRPFVHVAIPIAGAVAVPLIAAWWRRDRRRAFLDSLHRRPAYLLSIAACLVCAASWPLSRVVMESAAEESRSRALEVADAAEAFRRRTGAWPDSIEALESASGRTLPRPTFRGGWRWVVAGEALILECSTENMLDRFAWQLRVPERTWTRYRP
jgi:hypothetical protein